MNAPDQKNRDTALLRDYLSDGMQRLGISLDPEAVDRLFAYCRELIKWNKTINLVAAAPLRDLVELHFLDSLALLPLLNSLCPSASLLDIGSGAGFPGLALKAASPDRPVTLVEPRQKRATFLRHVIRQLGLTGATVHTLHLSPNDAGQRRDIGLFAAVTSRAVADLATFLPLAAAFCLPGGCVFCMKGKKAEEEIDRWLAERRAPLPLQLHRRHSYTLPCSGAQREILVFRKD